MSEADISQLKFDQAGLIAAVVQEGSTGKVLMLAYMNKESLTRTFETGETYFWSRSRQSLWHKGETSGNTQRIQQITFDCDADALLVKVEQKGNACHTGAYSCFFNSLAGEESETNDIGLVLNSLSKIFGQRKKDLPEGSYTTYLFKSGLDKILKKVGEEASETIIASKNHNKHEITSEVADLLYHLLVLLAEEDVTLDEIATVLAKREGKQAKPAKAQRV